MKTITITPKQERVLCRALEMLCRLGLGQLWTVAEQLEFLFPDRRLDHWDIRERYIAPMQKAVLGFDASASYGISNEQVHDFAKIAYDMECALRKPDECALHLGSEPMVSVNGVVAKTHKTL